MAGIWVKVIKEQKIITDFIYTYKGKTKFDENVREICGKLDIPTPLILHKHISHFNNFNQAKFYSQEFIESVDFDELVLENIKE